MHIQLFIDPIRQNKGLGTALQLCFAARVRLGLWASQAIGGSPLVEMLEQLDLSKASRTVKNQLKQLTWTWLNSCYNHRNIILVFNFLIPQILYLASQGAYLLQTHLREGGGLFNLAKKIISVLHFKNYNTKWKSSSTSSWRSCRWGSITNPNFTL